MRFGGLRLLFPIAAINIHPWGLVLAIETGANREGLSGEQRDLDELEAEQAGRWERDVLARSSGWTCFRLTRAQLSGS